jgi:hypothetical protein
MTLAENLGDLDACVAEQLLQHTQVGAAGMHVGGKGHRQVVGEGYVDPCLRLDQGQSRRRLSQSRPGTPERGHGDDQRPWNE